MITSNVFNTKNKLSELLQKVQQGETVMIVDRDKPVARIVPIDTTKESSLMDRLIADGTVIPPISADRTLPPLIENVGCSVVDAMLEMREEERG